MCVILLYSVFLDVYNVLGPVYLNTCVRVCHSLHGPLRECPRARRGYLITAPPSVCVPDVIGALAVWIQQQNKKKSEILA